MNEEQAIRAQLAALHRQYLRDCEPFIKRLAAIEAAKPPKPILIQYEQWASTLDNEVLK